MILKKIEKLENHIKLYNNYVNMSKLYTRLIIMKLPNMLMLASQ